MSIFCYKAGYLCDIFTLDKSMTKFTCILSMALNYVWTLVENYKL